MKLENVILYDTRANQPAATTTAAGTIYYVTDENVTERSNGTTWDDMSDAGAGAAAITSLTGDVTATGPGASAATIANNAVSNGKLRDSGALSVIGRSANSGGDPADISATAATDAVLRESGSVLGFGTIATGGIANAAVTDAKISNRAAVSVFGRSANSGGVGADIAAGSNDQLLARTSDSVAFQSLTVGMIPANTITGAKLTAVQRTRVIAITIDGGGSTITTGVKGYIRIPIGGTLDSWTILANQSGAIKIDVWKDTFANFPPTDADSITNAHEPEIAASGTNAEDTNISDWTSVTVTAGDVIGFNVDSCTSIQRATLEIVMLVTG